MIAIEETDRQLLVDTYDQIERLEKSIENINKNLSTCKIPQFSRQLRQEKERRERRLRHLKRQVEAILTMLP